MSKSVQSHSLDVLNNSVSYSFACCSARHYNIIYYNRLGSLNCRQQNGDIKNQKKKEELKKHDCVFNAEDKLLVNVLLLYTRLPFSIRPDRRKFASKKKKKYFYPFRIVTHIIPVKRNRLTKPRSLIIIKLLRRTED